MPKIVLITGATGDTGRASVREAIALGLDVRAIVRKFDERSEALAAQGTEVVVGDLFDINSIRSALEGAEAAYFVHAYESPRGEAEPAHLCPRDAMTEVVDNTRLTDSTIL